MLSSGKMLSVKRSNVRLCDHPPGGSGAQRHPAVRTGGALRKGDEVVVQGLTKALGRFWLFLAAFYEIHDSGLRKTEAQAMTWMVDVLNFGCKILFQDRSND